MHSSALDTYVIFTPSNYDFISKHYLKVASTASVPCHYGSWSHIEMTLEFSTIPPVFLKQ